MVGILSDVCVFASIWRDKSPVVLDISTVVLVMSTDGLDKSAGFVGYIDQGAGLKVSNIAK